MDGPSAARSPTASQTPLPLTSTHPLCWAASPAEGGATCLRRDTAVTNTHTTTHVRESGQPAGQLRQGGSAPRSLRRSQAHFLFQRPQC